VPDQVVAVLVGLVEQRCGKEDLVLDAVDFLEGAAQPDERAVEDIEPLADALGRVNPALDAASAML